MFETHNSTVACKHLAMFIIRHEIGRKCFKSKLKILAI